MGTKTERSKTTYDKMAPDYDTSREGIYTEAHRAELCRIVKLKDGDEILDVACGNGALLAELFKKARVNAFGVDLSEKMIESAKKLHPDLSFSVHPCCPLNFECGSKDVITVSCGFHHFEEPQGFANECMRVLKPNGAVYMAEPFFSPLLRFLANTIVFRFSREGDVKVYSAKELRAFFQNAGFADIQTYEKGAVQVLTARKSAAAAKS